MMPTDHRRLLVDLAYEAVAENVREDILEALLWAKTQLTDLEGSGHTFYVSATKDNLVCCSFAQPTWTGDHCGTGMEHGAQAIVMSVIEYLHGL